MSTHQAYRNVRPNLAIELVSSRSLGRCYNAAVYRITSARPLDSTAFRSLREAGFIGYGQEFTILHRKADGSVQPVPDRLDWRSVRDVEPTGFDNVPCVDIDDRTGEVVRNPSVNSYSGRERSPARVPYYVYECEDRIDSSD